MSTCFSPFDTCQCIGSTLVYLERVMFLCLAVGSQVPVVGSCQLVLKPLTVLNIALGYSILVEIIYVLLRVSNLAETGWV